MSLARAFTNKRTKSDVDTMMHLHLGRAASQRTGKPIRRNDISGPVALVSTTNLLSYEAPAIAGTAPISIRIADAKPSVDSSSDDESDRSMLSMSTNPTGTDNSSVEISPVSAEAEPNHLSCYFKPSFDSKAQPDPSAAPVDSMFDAPSIPKRVPSHSKRAHEHIHRKRAIQRLMSPPGSISSVAEVNPSAFTSPFVGLPTESTYGNGLQKLDEIVEGPASVRHSPEEAAEVAYLNSKNLAHLAASDYLSEIQSLIHIHFTDEPAWI